MDKQEHIENLKLRLLRLRKAHAEIDIKANNIVDGESFFDDLDRGTYDQEQVSKSLRQRYWQQVHNSSFIICKEIAP